jgi:multidrug efflux pump subunit AcrB
MKIAEFSVKHSLFVNLVSALLIIAGLISAVQLRREAFPEVSFDTVMVSTAYRGGSPEEVERLVTTPLEKELKEVDNIEEISSSSHEGISTISLEIDPDTKDKDKVINDIQKAVDRVVDFPEGVDKRPQVIEIDSSQIPVIKVALSGKLTEFDLRELADNLRERLEDINGVAAVRRSGWRDEEFWVEVDLNKMKDYHISIQEVMQALQARNVTIPAGKLKSEGKEFILKTQGEFTTKEEIEDTIIRANDLGNWLKVKDVATVRHAFQEELVINKALGTRAITLTVVKKHSGDTITIVNNVNKIIAEFKNGSPQELKISSFYDLSYYVKRRLNVLKNNGIIAFIFVVISLLFFLHPTVALFTALGIPIAMLTTLWVMNLTGMSINLITMFGLIVVLGMVVDDGIIISENVYRYVEDGMPPKEAAIKGTTEVIAPVLATVVTSIAAFSPLLFTKGLIGKFIRNIPLVVIIALSASLLEAFIILPSHLADFLKASKKGEKIKAKKESAWFKKLVRLYTKILNRALNNRYKVTGGIVAAFICAVIIARFFMPFVLFSSRGVEQFMVRAETEPGISLEKMNELMLPVEDFISKAPPEYLDTFETQIGEMTEERGFDPYAQQGSNFAQITVYLTPAQQRHKTAKDIIEELRPGLAKIKGFKKLYFREFKEGPPVGKSVELYIRGEDFSAINEIVAKIKDYLSKLKGVYDIADSYDLGNQELRIIVDQEKATRAYLSVGQIASSVRNAFEGGQATTIKRSKAEEEIKVLVKLPKEQRDNFEIFDKLLIPNSYGNLVPLKSVARVSQYQGLRAISHLEGKRLIAVTAEVDNKNITSAKANQLLQKEFKNIPSQYPGYNLKFGGETEERTKSVLSLVSAFWIAFLLIFLILATQFNSLIQPFVVMLTIPFGMIGVIIALLLHGEPFSFFSILGIVGLTGVVVNDSIVLVDFINKLRKNGVSRRDSIMEAGKLRLRPVILTTVTTVVGLSTVAYGIGGADPFLQPMALAIAWGLFFATGLTLIVMPCVYAIIDDVTLKIVKHSTVRKENNHT